MTEIKLEPCPFCSSKTLVEVQRATIFDTVYLVHCKGCKASGPHQATVEMAVEAWNTVSKEVHFLELAP